MMKTDKIIALITPISHLKGVDKLLKSKGWFDFVDDFVLPNQEEGVRIDTELNYPMTIQAPYIKCENTFNLLGQLKSLRNIL